MSIIVGVGVFVRRGGQVLVGKRLNSHGAGTWSLPGGRVEFGESYVQTATRELKEETSIDVTSLLPGERHQPFTMNSAGRATFSPPGNATASANSPFEAAAVTVLCPEEKAHMVVRLVVVDAPENCTPQVLEADKCESWHWLPWADIKSLAQTFAPQSGTAAPGLQATAHLSTDGACLAGGRLFAPLLAVACSDWDPFAATPGDAIRTL